MRDYCEHGRYVGGCGIDWMCGPCEDGVSAADYFAGIAAAKLTDEHLQALLWNAAWDNAETMIPDAATRELVRDIVRGTA